MRRIAKTSAIIVIILISVASMAVAAMANTGGFSVSPTLPENQEPGTNGFFDLKVSPGDTQDLVITIQNSEDKEIAVVVEAITATTNRNGIVNYTAPGTPDETLAYSFADMAKLSEDKLTIPPSSSRDITISVDMPKESFDGIILGSIRVMKELSDKEIEEGGMILNRYSYVLAVRIKQTDTPIETDFLLGNVAAATVNHRASIVAEIRNPMPKLVKGAETNAQIYPKDSDTAVFQVTKTDVEFAPNSIFPFSMVDEAGYGIQPGDYVAKIQVTHEDRTWEFERAFQVGSKEAENINKSAVNQVQMPSASDSSGLPTWAVIAIIAGALILIVAVILIIKAVSGRSREDINMLYKQLEEQTRLQKEQEEHMTRLLQPDRENKKDNNES